MINKFDTDTKEYGVISDEMSYDNGKWIRVIKRKYNVGLDKKEKMKDLIELKGKFHPEINGVSFF